jgi:hypothetical protein
MAAAHAPVIRPLLLCSAADRYGSAPQSLGDRSRTHGQPAALASGRGPGSPWVPRRRVSMQGCSDRLPAPCRVLRFVGSRPRRDGEPRSRARGGLADPDPSFLGRLTQSQTAVTDPPDDHSASEQLKNNRRTREDATPGTAGSLGAGRFDSTWSLRGIRPVGATRAAERSRRRSASGGIVIRRGRASPSGDGSRVGGVLGSEASISPPHRRRPRCSADPASLRPSSSS